MLERSISYSLLIWHKIIIFQGDQHMHLALILENGHCPRLFIFHQIFLSAYIDSLAFHSALEMEKSWIIAINMRFCKFVRDCSHLKSHFFPILEHYLLTYKYFYDFDPSLFMSYLQAASKPTWTRCGYVLHGNGHGSCRTGCWSCEWYQKTIFPKEIWRNWYV